MSSKITTATSSSTVADILERVLDMGVVVAGDIRIKLVDIELLTIQIRLVVCSIDKAREIGMDWWNMTLNRPEPTGAEPLASSGLPRTATATLPTSGPPSDPLGKLKPLPADAQQLAARLEAMEQRMKDLEKLGSKLR